MNNNLERELKIGLTKDQYDLLLHSYDFDKTITQTNTYYDTEDGLIKKKRGALRIRFADGKKILTIKLPNDETSKKEYEREIDASSPEEFTKEVWDYIHLHLPEVHALKPIASFTTVRNLLYRPEGEFCLDETDFGSVKDYEIEYEYHVDHNGIEKLNNFLKPAGLVYTKQSPSKLARAMVYKENL